MAGAWRDDEMIRTKIKSLLTLSSILFFCICVLSACATQKAAQAPIVEEPWGGLVEILPENSPIVAEIHGRDLLKSVKFVLDWFSAEPENWGAQGASMIRMANLYWKLFSSTAGGDPTLDATWHGIGVDAERPIVLAVHPVVQDGWMDAIEAGQQPTVNAPVLGFRMIVPTHTENVLRNFVSDALKTASYTLREEGIWGPSDTSFPWIWVNVGPVQSEIDVVFVSTHSTTETREREAISALKRARGFKRGAPKAPVFPESSLISISVHQETAATFARATAYSRALGLSNRVGIDERSAYLSKLVAQAIRGSQAFEVRSQELPMSRYTLSSSGFSMDFLLGDGAPRMRSSALGGIDSGTSDIGFFMDLRPLNDERARYLKLPDAERGLQFIDNEDPEDFVYMFTLFRSLALIAGNLLDAAPEAFSEPWASLVGALDGADVLEISQNQNLQILAHLKERPADRRQDAARDVASFFQILHAHLNGEAVPNPVAGVVPDSVESLSLTGSSGSTVFLPSKNLFFAQEVNDRETTPGDPQFQDRGEDDIAFFRAEPIWLVRFLSEQSAYSEIEYGRIAQRLGAIEARISPHTQGELEMIRWQIEMKKPLVVD